METMVGIRRETPFSLISIPGRCYHCGKTIGPLRTKDGKIPTRGSFISVIDKDGLFCTERCAAAYGVYVAKRDT